MRPAGEVSLVLLGAARELCTADQCPTLQELAAHARVGYVAAQSTLKNMTRHGRMRIVRLRKVPYRNRPVAEYAPADADHTAPGADV